MRVCYWLACIFALKELNFWSDFGPLRHLNIQDASLVAQHKESACQHRRHKFDP